MSAPGYAGNQYLLAVNGSAGAFVDVVARSTVRRLVIEESTLKPDGTAQTLQGLLQYKVPNDGTTDGFTTIFPSEGGNTLAAEGEVEPARIELGNKVGQFKEAGEVIGQLGQPIVGIIEANRAAATTMIKLRSGTATATTVMVTEYN